METCPIQSQENNICCDPNCKWFHAGTKLCAMNLISMALLHDRAVGEKRTYPPGNPFVFKHREDPDAGIYCYWDVSTCHITKEDNDLLHDFCVNGSDSLIVDSFDGGYWVFVPDDRVEIVRLSTEKSFSKAFVNLLADAMSMKIWWIRFSTDGEVHQGLPTFDW